MNIWKTNSREQEKAEIANFSNFTNYTYFMATEMSHGGVLSIRSEAQQTHTDL